jgi:ZIP family zinc transporter
MNDIAWVTVGLAIPFLGTTLGSAMVFFMRREMVPKFQKILLGFASGVMVAASVWSLLIPSLDQSSDYGVWKFVPALVGFVLGIGFLWGIDVLVPHLHLNASKPEGPHTNLSHTSMMMLAVTIHNIPEGMAPGVVFAGVLAHNPGITMAGAFSLAIGIAIQNFPEGAIISMPLRSQGASKWKAFGMGTLSGAVEPVSAILMILMLGLLSPVLPYFLSFAAGAMIYVVVEELIPEAQTGEHSNLATIGFAIGFAIMMVLDVALA